MKMTASDLDLLQECAGRNSEEAFSSLVSRHLDLVFSAALRQVGSPQLAEEVAQSVFTDLARNALRLKPDTILSAWLYQVTRRTAIDVVRKEHSATSIGAAKAIAITTIRKTLIAAAIVAAAGTGIYNPLPLTQSAPKG